MGARTRVGDVCAINAAMDRSSLSTRRIPVPAGGGGRAGAVGSEPLGAAAPSPEPSVSSCLMPGAASGEVSPWARVGGTVVVDAEGAPAPPVSAADGARGGRRAGMSNNITYSFCTTLFGRGREQRHTCGCTHTLETETNSTRRPYQQTTPDAVQTTRRRANKQTPNAEQPTSQHPTQCAPPPPTCCGAGCRQGWWGRLGGAGCR
jgi:hypothetical protein